MSIRDIVHPATCHRRSISRRPRALLLGALLATALLPALAQRGAPEDPALRSIQRGEYRTAIRIYSQQLRRDPANARLANNLALAHAMLRNRTTALAWLEQARRLAPGDPIVRDNAHALREWIRREQSRQSSHTASLRIDTHTAPGQPLRIRRRSTTERPIVF